MVFVRIMGLSGLYTPEVAYPLLNLSDNCMKLAILVYMFRLDPGLPFLLYQSSSYGIAYNLLPSSENSEAALVIKVVLIFFGKILN